MHEPTAGRRNERPIVIALGGNALMKRGESADAETQKTNVDDAAIALAAIALEHNLVVTHGNGPQIGLLALQAASYEGVTPYPLDVLGAETQGMIGYLIEQSLRNHLQNRPTATLLTQTVVDPEDPAFLDPTKFIGPVYSEAHAHKLAAERRWVVKRDGPWWRRVVPSPEPTGIVEMQTIRLLVDTGVVVICSGGGGIPVIKRGAGLHGVEAVVDKDLSASLLARELQAQKLIMLTDVPAVFLSYGTPEQVAIKSTGSAALRSLELPAGSMGPKVEAACRFVEETGGTAIIGRLQDAAQIVRGQAGTIVTAGGAPSETMSSNSIASTRLLRRSRTSPSHGTSIVNSRVNVAERR